MLLRGLRGACHSQLLVVKVGGGGWRWSLVQGSLTDEPAAVKQEGILIILSYVFNGVTSVVLERECLSNL